MSVPGQETHVLEIGSWEGRSSAWLLEQLLTHPRSTLTAIDYWQGVHTDQVELGAGALEGKGEGMGRLMVVPLSIDVVTPTW